MAIDPQRDNVRQRLAEILVQTNKPAEALQHVEILRQHQPDNPAVLVCYARCRRLQGELQNAAKLLDDLLTRNPRDAQALSERGLLALESHQPAEAGRWLRRAADLDPSNRALIYNLYHCLERLGKKEEAKKVFARLQDTAAELKRMDQLTQEVMKKPHNPSLRYEVGMIFLRNGFTQDGLHWLGTALKEDPRHRPTHEALAYYFQRQGEREQAAYHRSFLTDQKQH